MSFADLVASTDRAVRDHLGGVVVVYAPEVGDPVPVDGMFDANYVRIDPGTGAVEELGPTVWLTIADLPDDPMVTSPRLTIGGEDYTVYEREPDGMGTVRLRLHVAEG